MQRGQSGFAKLVLAIAGVVKEVRLSIEEQQEEARRREKILKDDLALAKSPPQPTRQPNIMMGITLPYVQKKVQEAIENRNALFEKAQKAAPIDAVYASMPSDTMEQCLMAFHHIKVQTDKLKAHIDAHTKSNLEQELNAMIALLAPPKL